MDIGPFKPSYYEAPEGRELVIINFTLEPAIEGTDLKPSGPELHDVKDQPMELVTYGLVSVRGEVERAFVVPVGTKLKTLKIRDVQLISLISVKSRKTPKASQVFSIEIRLHARLNRLIGRAFQNAIQQPYLRDFATLHRRTSVCIDRNALGTVSDFICTGSMHSA